MLLAFMVSRSSILFRPRLGSRFVLTNKAHLALWLLKHVHHFQVGTLPNNYPRRSGEAVRGHWASYTTTCYPVQVSN